jgi:hypothetical protein
MEQGVKNVDVKLIRDAASRAKSLGSMLSPDGDRDDRGERGDDDGLHGLFLWLIVEVSDCR